MWCVVFVLLYCDVLFVVFVVWCGVVVMCGMAVVMWCVLARLWYVFVCGGCCAAVRVWFVV